MTGLDPGQASAVAAVAAQQRGGVDTKVIEVGDVLAVTDFFVITHGGVARQVRAIAQGVQERLGALGIKPIRTEGLDGLQWVLIDYGSFVVHVFDEPRRLLYQLEQLWGDCPVLDWQAAVVNDAAVAAGAAAPTDPAAP